MSHTIPDTTENPISFSSAPWQQGKGTIPRYQWSNRLCLWCFAWINSTSTYMARDSLWSPTINHSLPSWGPRGVLYPCWQLLVLSIGLFICLHMTMIFRNWPITTAMLMVPHDSPFLNLTNHPDVKLVSSTWERLDLALPITFQDRQTATCQDKFPSKFFTCVQKGWPMWPLDLKDWGHWTCYM